MLLQNIRQLNLQIEKILKFKLEGFNLSIGQWEILNAIYESENNKVSAAELEKKLGVDKRVLSLSLKKLEEISYIERIDLPQDKRKKHIILSMEALEMAEDLLSIQEEINDVILMYLQESKDFENSIKIIEGALNEYISD